jgi:hypothetical protein
LRALRSNQRKVLRVEDSQPSVVIDLVAHPDENLKGLIMPQTPHSQNLRVAGEQELEQAVKRSEQFKKMLSRRDPNSIEINPDIAKELSALGYITTEEEKKP